MGIDARCDSANPYELKSGTSDNQITTARDVFLDTIDRWRGQYWVIGYGDAAKNWKPHELYACHPSDLASFFDRQYQKVAKMWAVFVRIFASARKQGDVEEADIQMAESRGRRSSSLNNPKITMKLVRCRCRRLDHQNGEVATKQLADFVASRPLNG
jgi:hypothetical protein